MTLLSKMILMEEAKLSEDEAVELYAELIRDKHSWAFHGIHGTLVNFSIERGIISKEGVIDWDIHQQYKDKVRKV